jgi:ATP/maltotriose-dependent transcriptional regulator MalT
VHAEKLATDIEERALTALSRSDNLFRGLARADDAKSVLLEAEVLLPAGPLHDQLTAQRALFALFEGDVAETLAVTDPLLARVDDEAYCIAGLPAAMIRMLAGRIGEAITIATSAFEKRVALSEAVHLGGPGIYLVAQALALVEFGNLAQATATAQFSYDAAATEQNRNGMAWLACALARAHLLTGRLASAARLGRESAVLFGELNHPGARWGYGVVALARAQLGDADAADEAIADLDAEAPTTVRMMDTELDRARAWTLAARGDIPRARSALLGAADVAASRGLYTMEAALLHDMARLGDAEPIAERFRARAELVDGDLMRARVTFVTALAEHDAGALLDASKAFEAIGAQLFAAEAANEAAIAYRRDGTPRPATAAAQLAQRLASECEGARTPSLMHGTGAAVLTKREREVATLASHGMSSREIASTLYVSIRTVDNHLRSAYEKLGISSRGDLGDALARAGY